MKIASTQVPLAESIIAFLFIACIIANTFLFARGQDSYSIKYEIMRKHRFFRVHYCASLVVEVVYKIFFLTPCLFLLTVVVMEGIVKPLQVFPVSVNGMIVLLMLVPVKREYYFWKELALWVLAFASQIISLLLYENVETTRQLSRELSAMFYSSNAMLFCLALLSREPYWEISEAVAMCKDKVSLVNKDWHVDRSALPKIFDGGLYGAMCRKQSYKLFICLYLSSVVLMGLNSYLVWYCDGSYLGLVGLVSNLVYDIFILSFNSLPSTEKSLASTFILVFLGRLLSFVFGTTYWIFGYCILYFFIGVFVGKLIINRRLPMKFQSHHLHTQKLNAFKTPQFVLLLLTVQIILMVLSAYLGVSSNSSVTYNQIDIPLWQFALIVIILTWVLIFYTAAVRQLYRHSNRIRSLTQYYFGIQVIQEYHIYVLLTYVLIIALGVYCYLFLQDKTIFMASIFIPLIYIVLFMVGEEWQNNDYFLFADIEEFNTKAKKLFKTLVKKTEVLKNKYKKNRRKGRNKVEEEEMHETTANIIRVSLVKYAPAETDNIPKGIEASQSDQTMKSAQHAQEAIKEQLQQFKQLKNWRAEPQYLSPRQLWSCLTVSDKKIFIGGILLFILCTVYVVLSYVICLSSFGLSVVICLVSYLTLFPHVRLIKRLGQLTMLEMVVSVFGFCLGACYWSFNYTNPVLGLIWASLHIVISGLLVGFGIVKGVSRQSTILLSILVIGCLLFISLLIGFTSSIIGSIIFAVCVVLASVCLIPLYYLARYGYIPLHGKLIPGVTMTIAVVGLTVSGFILQVASNMILFTLLMGFIFLVLFCTASSIAYQKQYDKYNSPHVYCAYDEPIYKFDSQEEKLKSSRTHKILYEFSSVVLVVYGACISLVFAEKYMAVFALSLFLVINFFQDILYSIKSYYSIALCKEQLSEQLVQDAFNDVLLKYMAEEVKAKDAQKMRLQLQIKKSEVDKAQTEQQVDNLWCEVLQLHEQLVKDRLEEEKFLFFWLVLIRFHLDTQRKQRMILFISQIKEILEELAEVGIFIESINSTLDFEAKYVKVTKEIEALPPLDFILYEEILAKHQTNVKCLEEQAKHHSQIEKKQHEAKEDELYEKIINQQSDTTTDKIKAFNALVSKIPKKGFFTDQQFLAGEQSLGQTLSGRVTTWRRPRVGQILCKNEFSAYDVKQGAIGDCYLISSLGVLGNKWLQQSFGMKSDTGKTWTNGKGAYMVKFHKFLQEIYVVIDDYLPVDGQGELVFARCEDTQKIWPALLEKAYAKLYSGYDKIVSGKCHRVLAEFTGGCPCEYDVQGFRKNPNGLWAKISNAIANKYLLAAGSPSSPLGDTVASPRGIIQGHAYSILDAKEVEGNKLIKLKNPHGSGGVQWKGDFSDNSEQMSKRMMILLDHQQVDDGVFWMTLEDFVHEYRSLYVCAVFGQGWHKIESIRGAWTVDNSYGTPNKSNNTYKNPQYGITVTKKCSLFVNLTQKAKSALIGVNYIYLRIQRNEGKRIKKDNLSSDLLCGTPISPTNAVSLSMQVILQANYYPYTFTLYVSCKDEGAIGQYTLQMYCNDGQAKVIPDSSFEK